MYMVWEPKVIIFRVADYDTVRSFYKAVLLLRILEEEPGQHVEFDLGTAKLRLEYEPRMGLPKDFGKASQIVFQVRSTMDILEALNKLNVDYVQDEFADGKHLDIADPEGRIITFISKY